MSGKTGVHPTFVPVADNGLLVEFGTEISDEVSDLVLAAADTITDAGIVGLVEIVPAFVNLLVVFDPLTTDHDRMQVSLASVLDGPADLAREPTEHVVEACYHPSLGIDLAAVADQCDMSVEAVVATHLGAEYRLCMYGFAPGYAYLSGVPPTIQVPRKTVVVRDVAATSLIIAGPQCLVTTLTMPTGWSVLGRSPTPILQDDPDDPVRFELGDRIRFAEIDLATFEQRTSES